MCRAQPAFTAVHNNIRLVFNQCIEHELHTIRTVVSGEFRRWHIAIAVSDLNGRLIVVKIVGKNHVVVAENPQAAVRVDEDVAVNLATVAVAQGKLGATLADRIESIRVFGRFIADGALILAPCHAEQVMFDQAVGRR